MNNTKLKNLLIILGIATIGFAVFYLYKQQDVSFVSGGAADVGYEDMLVKTQVFIQRRQQLSQTSLDVSIFEDARFNSLQSFAKQPKEIETGRSDPFAEVGNF